MDRRTQCLAKVHGKRIHKQLTWLFLASEWGGRLIQLHLHRPDHDRHTGGARLDVHRYLCRPSDVCKVSKKQSKVKIKSTFLFTKVIYFRAQFAENRSIFNTPNPRLMNVSMVKGISYKKNILHTGEKY